MMHVGGAQKRVEQPAGDAMSIAQLLRGAFSELDRVEAPFCYWKSRVRLPEALEGRGDIDLLFRRQDRHIVDAALARAGFKRFPTSRNRENPATATYLGYDEPTDRLFHLHVHYRVVVGEKLFPNYSLPWEDEFIPRAIRSPDSPIPTLDPTCEAIMLIVRGCLELRRTDPFAFLHWNEFVARCERDRTRLANCVDRKDLRAVATRLLDDDLAELLADALDDARPLVHQSALRRRLSGYLASYRIHNGPEARLRAIGRLTVLAMDRANKAFVRAPRPARRSAPGGGLVVSMLGVDGSGKSTAVSTLVGWLAPKVDVIPIYFGTGDGRPTLLLGLLKTALPLAMRLRKSASGAGPAADGQSKPLGPIHRFAMIVWAAAVALDKRSKLRTVQRAVARGMVVITDRYPQNEIRDFNDGPLLRRFGAGPKWLQRMEDSIYLRARRLAPDLVIKLIVTDETAKVREPTMDPAVIRKRIAALDRLEFPRSAVMRTDAEQPLEQVARSLKRHVWTAM